MTKSAAATSKKAVRPVLCLESGRTRFVSGDSWLRFSFKDSRGLFLKLRGRESMVALATAVAAAINRAAAETQFSAAGVTIDWAADGWRMSNGGGQTTITTSFLNDLHAWLQLITATDISNKGGQWELRPGGAGGSLVINGSTEISLSESELKEFQQDLLASAAHESRNRCQQIELKHATNPNYCHLSRAGDSRSITLSGCEQVQLALACSNFPGSDQ